MRVFPLLLACLPALVAAQDAREIVRRSVELDRKNSEAARNYTFLQRQEERELDSAGKVKSRESQTWDITLLEGSPYRRLVARNDQPLPSRDWTKEEEKLRKSIEDRRRETPEQRERRIAEWARRQQKQREPFREVPEAFDFRLVGEEALNGGATYAIDATPKPGYKPKLASAFYFPKLKMRLWIDKQDYQWVKVEAETLDTIAFGGILLRLAKGSRLDLEQARINHEVWLPKRLSVQASARIALFKKLNKDIEVTFSDFKKFQAESRVLAVQP